jgi:hypothetical protein
MFDTPVNIFDHEDEVAENLVRLIPIKLDGSPQTHEIYLNIYLYLGSGSIHRFPAVGHPLMFLSKQAKYVVMMAIDAIDQRGRFTIALTCGNSLRMLSKFLTVGTPLSLCGSNPKKHICRVVMKVAECMLEIRASTCESVRPGTFLSYLRITMSRTVLQDIAA